MIQPPTMPFGPCSRLDAYGIVSARLGLASAKCGSPLRYGWGANGADASARRSDRGIPR